MQGINFTEPMFKAVIEGRKTQTRRIIKDSDIVCVVDAGTVLYESTGERVKPRYKVGETLYLKEPYFDCTDEGQEGLYYRYRGDNMGLYVWQNKRFMPAKYARYFIKITGVRCERLQDISYEDCLDEGITCDVMKYTYTPKDTDGYISKQKAIQDFATLINSIHGEGTWDANPYVWVYDFELTEEIEKNIEVKNG